jgi:hypothetical protein
MAIFSRGTAVLVVGGGIGGVPCVVGLVVGGVVTRDMMPSSLKELLDPPRTQQPGGNQGFGA